MNILALDTSTQDCSVAITAHGNVFEETHSTPQTHADSILPIIDSVLVAASLSVKQLDAICFGAGPGAFTGLRIAAGVTQGLALGHSLPVIPVSSLHALAVQAHRKWNATTVLACIDARKKENYWAEYKVSDSKMQLVGVENIGLPRDINCQLDEADVGLGSGFLQYKDELKENSTVNCSRVEPDCRPQARDLLTIAVDQYTSNQYVNAESAVPVYLRDKVTD